MNDSLPFVSVIMPVRNEGLFIARSLGAVLNQDYPNERMEILVVDGMSTDSTRNIITALQKEHSHVRLLDNPRGIVAPGLNFGIREAKGEIIIRADGHCEIASDYVRQCVGLLNKGKWDVVGGPIETIGETPTAKVIAIAMSSWFGVGGSAFRTIKDREMEADTVPFPAYRREVFDKAGFFDEELVRNQDDEHNYRIRKMGGKILLSPKIKSRYYSRGTLKSLWNQYFQYGYWKVRVMQKHPAQMSVRQIIPAVFTTGLLGSLALLFFMSQFLLLFIGITGFYGFVNLSLSLYQWLIWRRKAVLFLPLVYTILHFSYGIGFIAGIIKFRDRWKI